MGCIAKAAFFFVCLPGRLPSRFVIIVLNWGLVIAKIHGLGYTQAKSLTRFCCIAVKEKGDFDQ